MMVALAFYLFQSYRYLLIEKKGSKSFNCYRKRPYTINLLSVAVYFTKQWLFWFCKWNFHLCAKHYLLCIHDIAIYKTDDLTVFITFIVLNAHATYVTLISIIHFPRSIHVQSYRLWMHMLIFHFTIFSGLALGGFLGGNV